MHSAAHRRQLRLARPSRRPPLLLTLSPIGRNALPLVGADLPRVAVFVREPDAPIGIEPVVLADAFRLTPRESNVAALIAHGYTVDAIGKTLRIGSGTVRNHLKRVFEKTGIRSQPALVAMLRGFVHPGQPSGPAIDRKASGQTLVRHRPSELEADS
jgi:DNA-binding CsgD family transcriptional regulator